ncbi:pyrroline-5-carboxylate reductase [Caenimonas sp. SL110]|uniref:pyrroline-5-carboxylate reductase n=1 Tax=Caenimonas sp. SL110 TaxID=1450524 RepID=UPI000654A9BB|nr:pyrroline-5-carboxylate reductase [Caenimonas sp. SL110]
MNQNANAPARDSNQDRIAFIGGGNMAGAIIGGLIRQGLSPLQVEVVEPFAQSREKLKVQFGVLAKEFAGPALARANVVIWAVKPQTFKEAAAQAGAFTGSALHLSVAAGIRSSSIAQWLGTQRIVRSMPNTPALVGKGMTALYARPAVTEADRRRIEQIISTTGDSLWVTDEQYLDAVTALSGSGPAYVFFFIEAMTKAGIEMGLSSDQARKLSIGTFVGASELARASDDPPEILRERVTSRGGTTHAAITSMEHDQLAALFGKALHAARKRATELGDEFGA